MPVLDAGDRQEVRRSSEWHPRQPALAGGFSLHCSLAEFKSGVKRLQTMIYDPLCCAEYSVQSPSSTA